MASYIVYSNPVEGNYLLLESAVVAGFLAAFLLTGNSTHGQSIYALSLRSLPIRLVFNTWIAFGLVAESGLRGFMTSSKHTSPSNGFLVDLDIVISIESNALSEELERL